MVPTRKIKTDYLYDIYACRACGKEWKSYYKKIGHKVSTCRVAKKMPWVSW